MVNLRFTVRDSTRAYVFESWQKNNGLLRAQWEVAEGDGGGVSCQVELYDPGLQFAELLGAKFIGLGGIPVPPELFGSGAGDTATPTPTPASTAGSGGSSANSGLSAQERAFLDAIAYAEGTGANYNVMFGFKRFISYNDHPHQVQSGGGYSSDAAGRYQFLSTTWDGIKGAIGAADFSPANQDKGAVELIRRRGALDDVKAGRFETAITKCNKEWASLPGSPYGQPTKTMPELRKIYDQALAKYQGGGGGGTDNQSSGGLASTTGGQTTQPPTVTITTTELNGKVTTDTLTPTIAQTATTQADRTFELTLEVAAAGSDQFFGVGAYLIGVQTDATTQTTTLTGRGVQVLISQIRRNTIHRNYSLRMLAERIAKDSGVPVAVSPTPLTEQITPAIKQQNQTDRALLQSEAYKRGLVVQEDGGGLKLVPITQGNATGVVLSRSFCSGFRWEEQAGGDRITGEALPPVTDAPSEEGAIGTGFNCSVSIPSTPTALYSIKPGDVTEVAPSLARQAGKGALARQYRVGTVAREWRAGVLSSNLSLYLPVKLQKKAASAPMTNANPASGATSATPASEQLKATQGDANGQYSVPGISGKVSNNTPVRVGGTITWGTITKNGTRIPENATITNNVVDIVTKFETIAVPLFGGRAYTITSAYRPPAVNAAVGGASKSVHLQGGALDFYVNGWSSSQTYNVLNPVWNGGLGQYQNGSNHCDQSVNRRWSL